MMSINKRRNILSTVHILNFVGKIFIFLIGKKIHGGINFCGYGGMLGTIVVRFAKYAS